jgi:drug/metabolite transporter (DMT)-like permease
MSRLRNFWLGLVAVGAGVICLTLTHTRPSIFGGVLLLVIGAAGYVLTGLATRSHDHGPDGEQQR